MSALEGRTEKRKRRDDIQNALKFGSRPWKQKNVVPSEVPVEGSIRGTPRYQGLVDRGLVGVPGKTIFTAWINKDT